MGLKPESRKGIGFQMRVKLGFKGYVGRRESG